MCVDRASVFRACAITVAVTLFGAPLAFADEDAEQSDDKRQVLEEMVITAGPKSGDPVDPDALYAEQMQQRILRDQERLRVLKAEEDEWRNAAAAPVEGPGRMQWGFSPKDELKMRRESDIFDEVQRDTVKPATVFRVGF